MAFAVFIRGYLLRQTDGKVADKQCDNQGFVDVTSRDRDSAVCKPRLLSATSPNRPCLTKFLKLVALLLGQFLQFFSPSDMMENSHLLPYFGGKYCVIEVSELGDLALDTLIRSGPM